MTDIFLSVLKMSLSASIVAGIVIIARLCLRRVPKIFSYILWSAVLLRLIFPFTIPIHVSGLPAFANSSVSVTGIEAIQHSDMSESATTEAIGNTPIPMQNEIPTIYEQQVVPYVVPSENERSSKEIALSVGAFVWLAGVAGMLGYAVWSYTIIRKSVSMAIIERVNIYRSRKINSAFVLGYFKPRIYIPEHLSENEAELVILHEQTHIRRGDNIIKLFAFITLSVYWINPVIWLSYALMCRDMEQSCDEAVVRELCGRGSAISDVKRRYGEMLITMAARGMKFAPVNFSGNSTKERMVSIMKYSPVKKKIMTGASIICVIALLLSLASCISVATSDTQIEHESNSAPVKMLTIGGSTFLSNAKEIDVGAADKDSKIDFSPLLECTELQSVNVTYSYTDDFTLLTQIPGIRSLSICRDNEYPFTSSDLSFLKEMKNLEALSINLFIEDDFDYGIYTLLSELENLKSLKIELTHNCTVENIDDSYLGLLQNIEYLDVNSNSNDISYLKSLTKLRGLNLRCVNSIRSGVDGYLLNMKGLESLSLYGMYDQDLSFLSQMGQLKELVFEESQLDNLEFVRSLNNLEVLRLINSTVIGGDISPVSELHKLRQLEISVLHFQDILFEKERDSYLPRIADLAQLSSLTQLTDLNLSGNFITDISALRQLDKIERLDLSYNNITDISALSGMNRLTYLDLYFNMVSVIDSLAGKSMLTQLNLSDNEVNDITPLTGCRSLTFCDVSANGISDIEPLSECVNMTCLNCAHNRITDISPLAKLTELDNLDVSENKVSSAECLSELRKMRELSVSYNELQDLSFVENMTGLEILRASGNRITDIAPLSDLTFMTVLLLSSNEITDISPLANMSKLNTLLISSNSISDASVLYSIDSLLELNISYNNLSEEQISRLREQVLILD